MRCATSLVRRFAPACAAVLTLALGLHGQALAQIEQTLFAKQYDHAVAGPTRAADTVAVPDNFTGPFKLRIQNGTADESVNAGWVYRTFRSPGPVAGDPSEFMRIVIGE